MTLSLTSSRNVVRCANPVCVSYTNHETGICPRCRERGVSVSPASVLARVDSTTRVPRGTRKPRTDDEHDLQVELVDWCRTGIGSELAPCLKRIIAIPNGGSATKMMNIRMWQEGRAKGFPDLFLPVALGGYHGAMLELKRPGEVPDAAQYGWLAALAAEGYCASWANDLEIAKTFWLTYAGRAS